MSRNWFHRNFINNDTKNWRFRIVEKNFFRLFWKAKCFFDFSNKNKLENISIVVVGRNDNYGGNFSERLRLSIDWNYANLPNPELIYVEWNIVKDKPSDTEWISERYPNSKSYIIDEDIHQMYCDNPKIKMMEYFAKNLGIREAGNEWIAIINADVLLAENTLKNLKKLSKKFVYGSHYINIDPESVKIENGKLHKRIINTFSTNFKLMSVVGNFILTHRDNWFKMGGYDESLKNVRAGVDNNGLFQILHHGIKPMVIGDHYHLDHSESLIKGKNDTHGFNKAVTKLSNIPYTNESNWGLQKFSKIKVGSNVWKLKLN
jgi:hypothetical protein